nr:dTDP-4-dehydrorhamnose 3,5-epimerase [Paenibacillus xylanexedens]
MKLIDTKFEGLYLIEPNIHFDHRGYFVEAYNQRVFNGLGINSLLLQDNQSKSFTAGTIRGLHYQSSPYEQTKIIRVLSGEIFDVVVDLRNESPTFGMWEGFELNSENKRQLIVPKGFAHGFCTLAPNTEVIYKVDNYYSPEHDCGILWNDPNLAIKWPVQEPIISEKDKNLPKFSMIFG